MFHSKDSTHIRKLLTSQTKQLLHNALVYQRDGVQETLLLEWRQLNPCSGLRIPDDFRFERLLKVACTNETVSYELLSTNALQSV